MRLRGRRRGHCESRLLRISDSDTAWVRVFDDGACWLIKLRNQFESGIGVIQVIVAETFALDLIRSRHAGTEFQ